MNSASPTLHPEPKESTKNTLRLMSFLVIEWEEGFGIIAQFLPCLGVVVAYV